MDAVVVGQQDANHSSKLMQQRLAHPSFGGSLTQERPVRKRWLKTTGEIRRRSEVVRE
jgi:hypothetical protein